MSRSSPVKFPKLQPDESEASYAERLRMHGVEGIESIVMSRQEVMLRDLAKATTVQQLKPILQRMITTARPS